MEIAKYILIELITVTVQVLGRLKMLVIPIKINKTIYYINALQASDNMSNASSKLAGYKKVINYINFSISRISPKDITIKDVKDFNIGSRSLSGARYSGTWAITGNPTRVDGNYTYYQVTIGSSTNADTWSVSYPSFTGNDLKNIGVLLKTLILNAHTHDGSCSHYGGGFCQNKSDNCNDSSNW
jgi:hypothetical protein